MMYILCLYCYSVYGGIEAVFYYHFLIIAMKKTNQTKELMRDKYTIDITFGSDFQQEFLTDFIYAFLHVLADKAYSTHRDNIVIVKKN